MHIARAPATPPASALSFTATTVLSREIRARCVCSLAFGYYFARQRCATPAFILPLREAHDDAAPAARELFPSVPAQMLLSL